MSHFERLCLALFVISASLCCGYCVKLFSGKWRFNEAKLTLFRKKSQEIAIFGLLPFSAMLSLWGLPEPKPQLLLLPLLGLLSYIFGGLLALAGAKLLRLTKIQTGSFYCCGSFTNLGAVGGLVSLLFLGENAIALVALYRVLEEVYYFGMAFPVARFFGSQNVNSNVATKKLFFNPVLLLIVLALAFGIALNLGRVARPEIFGSIASISMLCATVVFLFSIGMTLRFGPVWNYWKEGLAMCLIKFLFSPIIILSLAAIMGLATIENGLPFKTVAILSCMPVAMTALVPPSLFDLDIDLANACWIFTTLGLIAVLPVLMLLLPHV